MKKLLAALLLLGLLSPLASANENPLQREVEISINGQSQTLNLLQLGVQLTPNTHETFWQRAFSSVLFLNKLVEAPELAYSWDTDRSEKLIRRRWQLPAPEDASFILINGEIQLQEAIPGDKLNTDHILQNVTSKKRSRFSFESEPQVVLAEENISSHQELVSQLLNPGLVLIVKEEDHFFPAQVKDLEITEESISLTPEFTDYLLETLAELVNRPAENLTILEANPEITNHATTEGHVRDGIQVLKEDTSRAIQNALNAGQNKLKAVTGILPGRVINKADHKLGPLKPIATGMSNFAGSIPGRDFNVRKGLNEHLNGILIPPGAEFSFNSFLDGPITLNNGWKQAYAIFLGTELRPVPGGGICQTSTTLYRAALEAGLDITDHRSHSLYIAYYDEYGKGLDATIFSWGTRP